MVYENMVVFPDVSHVTLLNIFLLTKKIYLTLQMFNEMTESEETKLNENENKCSLV